MCVPRGAVRVASARGGCCRRVRIWTGMRQGPWATDATPKERSLLLAEVVPQLECTGGQLAPLNRQVGQAADNWERRQLTQLWRGGRSRRAGYVGCLHRRSRAAHPTTQHRWSPSRKPRAGPHRAVQALVGRASPSQKAPNWQFLILDSPPPSPRPLLK